MIKRNLMRTRIRVLSLLLCGTVLFSVCTPLAFAEAQTTQDSSPPAAGLCEHHPEQTPDSGFICEICSADAAPSDEAPAITEQVQGLLDALPTAEELSGMSGDEQNAAYNALQAAYEAYEALTGEQKAEVTGAEIFDSLFAFFNSMTNLLEEKSEYNIESEPVTITDEGGPSCPGHLITGTGTSTTNTITVTNGIHNITLQDVNIDVSGQSDTAAFSISDGATVHLTLRGENTLKSGMYRAGLEVPAGAELVITPDSTGSLNATGGEYGAGIGGRQNGAGGEITISGGTVKAASASNGAGIGGGQNGAGGTIIIDGGTVTATSRNGAGIGGGQSGTGGTITINGGTVEATSTNYGAGIGGGNGSKGDGGTITINGGTVTATSNSLGAGIGGGYGGAGGAITINGGKVNAASENNGAGIGGGQNGAGGTIIINGGDVTAAGRTSSADSTVSGAGIGGGQNGLGGEIIIKNGTVEAISKYGAGIGSGSGNRGIGGEITIEGGTVKATSEYGVGIGGGTGSTITINDGTVTAQGGKGAGIGGNGAGIGGDDGSGGTIDINGGTVKATSENGAGIGGGDGGAGGTIDISGGTVKATGLNGAGIGGGGMGAGGTIDISSGTVEAASKNGAGIGGGTEGAGGTIAISGGTVKATSELGAGIGGGAGGDGGQITITGGTVEATSELGGAGIGGAGIGGGDHGAGGEITIEGGTVTATGSFGAGIGGGYEGIGGTIAIEGGTVTAASSTGAGIGGGEGGAGGTITISDGTVTAASSTGAGIGGGKDSDDGGEITISGGTVDATSISSAGIGGGDDGGTFAANGSAFISASSISDQSGEDSSWSGVIFVGDAGKVYGSSITLTADAEIPSGKTLTIENGQTLTVGAGVTLNNAGTIKNAGTLNNNGTINVEPSGKLEGTVGGSGTISCSVTVQAATGGTASASLTSAAPGTTITLTAAADSGYHFKEWQVLSGNVTISGSSFTMPAGNVIIKAIFEKDSESGNSGGGSGGFTIVKRPDSGKSKIPTAGQVKPVKPDKNGNAAVDNGAVQSAVNGAKKEAKKNGNTANGVAVVIPITPQAGQTSFSVTIKAQTLNLLVREKVKRLEISIEGVITGTMDADLLKWLDAASANGDIIFRVKQTDSSILSKEAQAAVGARPAYDLSLAYLSRGKETSAADLGGCAISVRLPYAPARAERSGNLYAVYLDSKGGVEWLTKSSYDPDLGAVIFETGHFSVFGIGYKNPTPTFTDIKGHWAEDHIIFAASRGLLAGTGNNQFSPDTGITRGMFVTALGRLAGIDPADYKTGKFTDVKADAYYAPYVNWAAKEGIVNGTAASFSPDSNITREQMAVIVADYAKKLGYELPAAYEAVTFADNAEISSRAAKEVKAMQQAGIMAGKDGSRFDPKGTATRAEAAAVLRRFTEIAIDPQTAQGWMQNHSGSWQYLKNGRPAVGWLQDDKKWYWLDEMGWMFAGGWKQIDGKWYYFYANGSMAINTVIDGRKIGSDGAEIKQN